MCFHFAMAAVRVVVGDGRVSIAMAAVRVVVGDGRVSSCESDECQDLDKP